MDWERIMKNRKQNKTGQRDPGNKIWEMCRQLRAGSVVCIFGWVFFVVFMSTYMREGIFEIAGLWFSVFCYFAVTVFFLCPVILIEREKNPVLIEQKKKRADASGKTERYISKSGIAAIVLGCISVAGGIITLTDRSDIGESLPPTILFLVGTVIFGVISTRAPKTKAEAEERKKAKLALQEAQREKAEYEKRMSAYRGIYLTEQQIRNLENRIELPVIKDTSVFLKTGEVAVYYSAATRRETVTRVIGQTGGYSGGTVRIANGFSIHTGSSAGRRIYDGVDTDYAGELVLTNKRVIFISDQKGFEVAYGAITAGSYDSDGITIQKGSQTYSLLLPKAELAALAFNAVLTGELPIAKSVDCESEGYDDSIRC